MIVRTWVVNRFGMLIPMGCVAAAGILTFDPTRHPVASAVGLLLFVGLPTFVAVRAVRAGVVLEPDRLVIRGWWWSRSIARDRVDEVTESSWLRWRTRGGRRMLSPLAIFWNFGDGRFVPLASHNEESIAAIRKWIRRDPITPE